MASSRNPASLERDPSGRPRFRGCSNILEFEFLGKLGEGTFGFVFLESFMARGKCSVG